MIRNLMRFLPVVLFSVLLAGCNSDTTNAGDPDADNLSGAWYGAGFYDTDNNGNPFHMDFTMDLNLVHSGTLVQGSYKVVRPSRSMAGSIVGTFDGTNIQLTFSPHGSASGTVAGGVIRLNWIEGAESGWHLSGPVQLGRH